MTKKLETLATKAQDSLKDGLASARREYPELDDIRENVEDLKSNSAALARHVYTDGREALSSAGAQAGERLNEWRDSGTDGLRKLEGHISRNPGQSVAIAFAAGLLASLLLGRK